MSLAELDRRLQHFGIDDGTRIKFFARLKRATVWSYSIFELWATFERLVSLGFGDVGQVLLDSGHLGRENNQGLLVDPNARLAYACLNGQFLVPGADELNLSASLYAALFLAHSNDERARGLLGSTLPRLLTSLLNLLEGDNQPHMDTAMVRQVVDNLLLGWDSPTKSPSTHFIYGLRLLGGTKRTLESVRTFLSQIDIDIVQCNLWSLDVFSRCCVLPERKGNTAAAFDALQNALISELQVDECHMVAPNGDCAFSSFEGLVLLFKDVIEAPTDERVVRFLDEIDGSGRSARKLAFDFRHDQEMDRILSSSPVSVENLPKMAAEAGSNVFWGSTELLQQLCRILRVRYQLASLLDTGEFTKLHPGQPLYRSVSITMPLSFEGVADDAPIFLFCYAFKHFWFAHLRRNIQTVEGLTAND